MGTHYRADAAELTQGTHKGSCGRNGLEYQFTDDKDAVTCGSCKRTKAYRELDASDVAVLAREATEVPEATPFESTPTSDLFYRALSIGYAREDAATLADAAFHAPEIGNAYGDECRIHVGTRTFGYSSFGCEACEVVRQSNKKGFISRTDMEATLSALVNHTRAVRTHEIYGVPGVDSDAFDWAVKSGRVDTADGFVTVLGEDGVPDSRYQGVPTGGEVMPEESIKVDSVVTGEDKIRSFANRVRLRAYVTKATTGMSLTRVFKPTIKGFNADYGTSCKSWADVIVEATRLLAETALGADRS